MAKQLKPGVCLVLLGTLIPAVVHAGSAEAASGQLDPTFGHRGKVTTSLSAHGDEISSIVVQPDGKILAGGTSRGHLALVRYRPDGSLDPDFGTAGVVRTTYGLIAGLAMEADGSIVAGARRSGTEPSVLVKFHSDGSPDADFGTDGSASLPIEPFCCHHAVALQPDGKIVVAGANVGNTFSDFALARLNKGGSVDTTFGSDGMVDLGGDCAAGFDTIAIQSDGRILAGGGDSDCEGDFSSRVVRVTPSGALDKTFKASVRIAPGEDAFDVSPAPRGGILVAAQTETGALLARYTSKGILDRSFGQGGVVTTPFECGHALSAFTVQANGDILAAGSDRPPGVKLEFELTRLRPNGTLDPAFGTGGRITTGFANGAAAASSLAIQGDSKILVGGFAAGSHGTDFALARYLSPKASTPASGSAIRTLRGPDVFNPDCLSPKPPLDPTFGRDGVVHVKPRLTPYPPASVTVEADGKILVATENFEVVRFRSGGHLDSTFGGGDGVARVTFPSVRYPKAIDLALQSDGKVLVSGGIGQYQQEFAMVRLTQAGHLDHSFGHDGRVTAPPSATHGPAQALALQPNGDIVVVGGDTVSRYRPDGSLDPEFGHRGRVTTRIGPVDVAVQASGDIVVFGGRDIALYTRDGTLDPAFGRAGVLPIAWPKLAPNCEVRAGLAEPDGKIVVVGGSCDNAQGFYDPSITLGRYLPEGGLDRAFGEHGWTVVKPGEQVYPDSIALGPSGKIAVGGDLCVCHTGDDDYFMVARFHPNGHLDRGLAWHGLAIQTFAFRAPGVAFQPDGKIVAVGYSRPSVVVRYRRSG